MNTARSIRLAATLVIAGTLSFSGDVTGAQAADCTMMMDPMMADPMMDKPMQGPMTGDAMHDPMMGDPMMDGRLMVKASDGQSLSSQTAEVQALFIGAFGDCAGERWATEHEAELKMKMMMG